MGKHRKRSTDDVQSKETTESANKQVKDERTVQQRKTEVKSVSDESGKESLHQPERSQSKKDLRQANILKRLKQADDEESENEDDETEHASSDKNDKVKMRKERVPLPVIPAGTLVIGRVDLENERIRLPPGTLLVQFRLGVGKRYGKIDLTEIDDKDKWTDSPLDKFKNGQFVRCAVLKSIPSTNSSDIVEMSLKPSLVEAATNMKDEKKKAELFQAEIDSANALPTHDELVTGYVVNANEKGCFIRISRNLTARVLLKNLSQGFVKNVSSEFPMGKLVAGRVLNCDELSRRVEMTLRSSAVVGESEKKWAWNNLKAGTIIDGVIHKLIPAGILVTLPAAGGLTGLCHLSQVFDSSEGDNAIVKKTKKKVRMHKDSSSNGMDEDTKQHLRANISQTYRVGDSVKCLVIEIDEEARKIQLGMKPSYFQGLLEMETRLADAEDENGAEDEEGNDDDDEEDDEEEGDEEEEDDNEDVEMNAEAEDEEDEEEAEDDPDDGSLDENDGEEGDVEETKPAMTLQEALKQTGIATKDANNKDKMGELKKKLQATKTIAAATSNDVEDEEHKSSKVNNKRRDALKRKAEATTAELEDKVASGAAPETVDEFERALVSQRNSSLIWIQYISLLVSMGDLDKARAVGERALKTITFEHEDERNNVWSALLSLELQFGTADLAKAFFARMVRSTDEKWAYMTLCDAYWSLPDSYPDRIKSAEEALRGAKKASKQQSAKVWIRHFRLKFDADDVAGGRKLLKEVLRFLPKHKHVKVMLSFARLEFSHEKGDMERARTIMEGILDSYPKRTDVWHVFIDLEAKYGTAENVRTLFQRALSVRMSTKKIKSLFKKWLQFEAGPHGGGDEYVEQVKEKAREFVASLVGEASDNADDE